MSFKYSYLRSLIFIFLLLISGCQSLKADLSYVPDTTAADMSGYMGMPDNGCFKKISLLEMDELFKNEGSGIFYMGHESCSFCQSIVQYLNQAGEESGVTIYYIDSYDDEYPLYKEEYQAIYIDDLYTTLREDDGKKAIYTPQVFTVVNGIVKDSLIAAKDWSTADPSDKQIEKLIRTYKKMFEPFIP